MSVKSSNSIPGSETVVRAGYLKKLKTFKKKYFVLRAEGPESSARLEYYDSEKKFNNGQPPKRSIPLKTCFNINKRVDTKHKHVIALYTKDDCFCIVLENEDELEAWLRALLSLQHGEEAAGGETPRHTFGTAGNCRERCDSMPSRARTSSEGTHPIHTWGQPRLYLASHRPQSLYVREISHSPPAESPISPPSAACSTDSADSSLSIDDSEQWVETDTILGRYGHSLTPDEAIAEENYDDCPDSPYLPQGTSPSGYLPMAPISSDDGYVDMSLRGRHANMSPAVSTSSITSGTPSTDMRFAEYPLEKVSAYFTPSEEDKSSTDRPIRAYSVGSRPDTVKNKTRYEMSTTPENARVRAFSVGSKTRKLHTRVLPPHGTHIHPKHTVGEEKEWAEENYEHLIKSLIEDGNEVAVEYLLDNLSKLERKPTINFVALAVTAASTSSLSRFYTYYTPVLLKLLGKMNSQERDRLYKERPYDVLTHLMNLKLERCDEMVEDVWKTRPPQPVCQTLLADVAKQVAEGNSDSLQTFMEFWKKINETNEEIDRIGEQLLPYLFQFDEKEIREILDGATDNEKKKVVEYVKSDEGLTPEYCKPWLLNLVVTSCLGSGNEEGKKFMEDLISSGKGLEICTYLISNGKFEEFKKFFDTANGSDKFKKRLFTMRGNDIFVSLCMTKGKSIFDQFLSWYFCDENRESKFKQNLVLSGIGIEVIINTVLRSNGSNCTWKKVYQDKFIEWGGLKESEFMIKFQGEQRESMRRRNICVNLLFEQSSVLVNEFLNWCFPDDGEKIDEFKKDFIRDKAVNFCVNKIEAEKLYAVKNFLDWIDLPEEEREKLLSRCKALLPGRHKDVETAFAKGNSEALLAEQECEKTEDYSNNNKKKRQRVSAGNTEPKGKRFVQSNSPESSMEEMKVEVALCQGNSTVREF